MRRGLLFLTILVICSCETGDPEVDIPQTPILHPQTSSIPQQNAIRIEWDLVTEDDLAGYNIYRAMSSEEEDFRIIATVSEQDSHYEDTDLETGVEYYYRISAFDDLGNESDKSDPVHYTLLEKPIPVQPADQAVIDAVPDFVWLGVSGTSSYTIHVQSRAPGLETWEDIWSSDKVYPYQDLRKTYNDDGLALALLERGMTYRWRVDSSGGRYSGSQSRWQYFSVG